MASIIKQITLGQESVDPSKGLVYNAWISPVPSKIVSIGISFDVIDPSKSLVRVTPAFTPTAIKSVGITVGDKVGFSHNVKYLL